MTIRHAVTVFDATGGRKASDRLVLLEAAYRADKRGIVRASQSEIAEITSLSRRTVADAFAQFEEACVMRREGHGRYKLDLSALEGEDGPIIPVAKMAKKLHVDADVELARLQAIRRDDEAIYWHDTPQGVMPVLGPYKP